MISAQMAMAVSSGVRAPMSMPIGAISRAKGGLLDAGGPQAFQAPGMGTARAHGAQVAHPGAERGDDGGHVELVVVGQHAHGVTRPQVVPGPGQVGLGPLHDDLVGVGEPPGRGEGGPGVAHRHPVTEHFGHPDKCGGEIDGPKDHHATGGREHLEEHRHVRAHGLPVGPVVASGARPAVQGTQGVAGHDVIEPLVT